MKFNSTSRRRLAEGESVGEGSDIPLPRLSLSPDGREAEAEPSWSLRLAVAGRWYHTSLREEDLFLFLQSWHNDPEGTFEEFFLTPAPKGSGRTTYGEGEIWVGSEVRRVAARVTRVAAGTLARTETQIEDVDF